MLAEAWNIGREESFQGEAISPTGAGQVAEFPLAEATLDEPESQGLRVEF
jgi:hypothetical protein